jgi:hypothetical protein
VLLALCVRITFEMLQRIEERLRQLVR